MKKKTRVSMYVPQDVVQAVKTRAKKEGISVSSLLRRGLNITLTQDLINEGLEDLKKEIRRIGDLTAKAALHTIAMRYFCSHCLASEGLKLQGDTIKKTNDKAWNYAVGLLRRKDDDN